MTKTPDTNASVLPPDNPSIFNRRVAKLTEILDHLGIAKPTLYEYMRDQGFPRPICLSSSGVRGARLWYVDEIEAWMASRPRGGG